MIIRNIKWSILDYSIYPLLMLLATPIYIHNLGANNYSIYVLYVSFSGLGGIASLGIGTVLLHEISKSSNILSRLEQSVLIRSAVGLLSIAILVLAVFTLIFSEYATAKLFSKINMGSIGHNILYMAVISIAIEQFDNLMSSTMRAIQDYKYLTIIDTLTKITIVLSGIFVVMISESVFYLALILVFCNIVKLLVKAKYIGGIFGWKSLVPYYSVDKFRYLLSGGLWAWVQTFTGFLYNSLDKIIIGSFFGPQILTTYNAFNQLAQQIHLFVSAALNSIFPYTSSLISDSKNEFLKFARKSFALNMVLSLATGIAVILIGPHFIPIWIDDRQISSQIIFFQYLVVGYILISFNVSTYYILMGLGSFKAVALISLMASVGSIFTLLLFTDSADMTPIIFSKISYAVLTYPFFIIAYSRIRQFSQMITSGVSGEKQS